MPSSRSDRPVAPDFHPEFGFFCPSPRRRRGVRLVVLAMMTSMAIGATMGLAVAHRTDGQGAVAIAKPNDAQPLAGVPTPRNDTPGLHDCKADSLLDLVALFLRSACDSNNLHARHGGRAANRGATVIIGRTDVAPIEAIPAPAPPTASERPPPNAVG